MASLKDIRRRIQAVRGTQKVTRAMKLVAAARLKRAQREAIEGRAYASALYETAVRVSRRLGNRAPSLWRRSENLECIDLVLVSSDRGLCGGFNENLLRAIEEGMADLASYQMRTKVFVIGRKGWARLAALGCDAEAVSMEEGQSAAIERLVAKLVQRFCDGESAGCNLAFNRFISAAHQEIAFWNLLPIYQQGDATERHLEYLAEPSREEALHLLAEELLRSSLRQALLESSAAELGARMAAMDAATKNADEMIAHLTSVYNRKRQEHITTELMDIVNGAEALR
jgi:F-type H+-transporting ATPase subunit gamma